MGGRPRTFDRETALELAIDAFWENGYQGTSISHLTKTMGIAPPSLYAAFGDKSTLFAEAVECYSKNLRAAMEESLGRPRVHDAVSDLLRSAAEHYTQKGTPQGCLVMSEPLLIGQRAEARKRVAERIQEGVAAGELDPDFDAQVAARFIDAILFGMSAQARDGASSEQLLEVARRGAAAALEQG
jgi:AcrR family transcriptional regulator